jgi:uncharacterized protein YjbI with pentapeptide repeats
LKQRFSFRKTNRNSRYSKEIFAGINFREFGFNKDFAGINFRELSLTKDFAGINFRECAFYKDFAGVNFAFFVRNIFSKTLLNSFENVLSKD